MAKTIVTVDQGGTGAETASAARTALGAAADAFTQAGTGAVATTVDAKLKEVVSVKDFGAVGDGSNDDTAEIQAALDAGTGNAVFFPVGDYKITDTLTVGSNTELRGEGWKSKILQTTADKYGFYATGKTDIAVNNIYLYGNGSGDTTGYGIFIGDSTYCKVTNCKLENWGKDGIYIGPDNSHYNLISGNYATANGRHGIVVAGGDHNKVENNICANNTSYGIDNEGSGIEHTIISGNTCHDNVIGVVSDSGTSGKNVITNNICFDNSTHGIQADGAYDVVSNNQCYSNTQYGMYCGGDNQSIEGNVLKANGYSGLYHTGNYGSIQGNQSRDNTRHGFYFPTLNNSAVGGNVAVDNDYANSDTYDGFKFENTDWCVIEGNLATNTGVTRQVYGMNFNSESENNILSDNQLAGNKTGNITGAVSDGFTQAGTDAVERTVDSKLKDVVSVKDFGAVGDGSNDDTAEIQAAIDAGTTILFPVGNYKITDIAVGYALLVSGANKRLVGQGKGSILTYTSATVSTPALKITADSVRVESLSIDGSANATKTVSTRANCNGITTEDVEGCVIEDCYITGGHYGIHVEDVAEAGNVNKNNQVLSCVLRNTYSSGVHLTKSEGCLVQGCDAKDSGTDGFKTDKLTKNLRIIGNVASSCTRDGFDFYDGLIESTVSDNISEGNTLWGFEIKGSIASGDYVVRDCVIDGNVATGNGYDGFSLNSVRNTIISNCNAVSNTRSGFIFNTVQGVEVSGCMASKNTQHGFNLDTSTSRTAFTGCYAIDNSWDDGTVQNGTYHGFNIKVSNSGQFSNCTSIIGTITDQKGGQGYGFYWAAVSTGSRVANCYTLNNVTGGFGGVTGWAADNEIFNCTDNGTYKGFGFNSDALDETELVGSLVLGSGDIGIGTTDPTFAAGGGLHVTNITQANLRLEDNATQFFDVAMQAGNAYLINRASGIMSFRTDGTERLKIESGGRVTVKKASNSEVDASTLVSATTITPDLDAADNFSLTLDHDATLANPTVTLVPGQSGCIVITQGSTGGTMVYGSEWLFESDGGAVLLSDVAGKVDNLVYYVAATDAIHAVLLKDFV